MYHLNLIEIGEIVEEAIRKNDRKREQRRRSPSPRRSPPRKHLKQKEYEYFDDQIFIPDWKDQKDLSEDEFMDWCENRYGITIKSINHGSRPDQKWAVIVLNSVDDQRILMDNSDDICNAFKFRKIWTRRVEKK